MLPSNAMGKEVRAKTKDILIVISLNTRPAAYPSPEGEATFAVLWWGQVKSQVITGGVVGPKHIKLLKAFSFNHL